MINPSYSITAELYLHAARGSVWHKFCQLQDWPRWDAQIITARWLDQQTQAAWHEGARFQLQLQSRFGPRLATAVVRMVVPDSTLVWESATSGLNIVYNAHFVDELGGCKLRIRHTYHGLSIFLAWLARGRQQKQLDEALYRFKAYVERR